jgi:hypothetical protein
MQALLRYGTGMRTLRPLGHPSSLPARGRRAVAVVLVAAVVLAGCSRGGGDVAPDDPLEPGQPIDVTGRAGLVFHDLSTSGTLVFTEGSPGDLPVVADDAAIRAAAAAIRTWLDAVLSERNRGLTTTVAQGEIDAAAFARSFGVTGSATDGLPDTQVATATYLIEVAYSGRPGWALARVESILVATSEPSTEIGRRLDSFVFTIDESGAIEFIALEVAP